MEDVYLGKASERIFLPLIRKTLPEIVDMHFPPAGVFHNMVLISIDKRYPGHARKNHERVLGLGQLMFSKCIVVVDKDVNVQDAGEVAWVAGHARRPRARHPVHAWAHDDLENASDLPAFGSKMGIDATRKWASEGFTREWPTRVVTARRPGARAGNLGPCQRGGAGARERRTVMSGRMERLMARLAAGEPLGDGDAAALAATTTSWPRHDGRRGAAAQARKRNDLRQSGGRDAAVTGGPLHIRRGSRGPCDRRRILRGDVGGSPARRGDGGRERAGLGVLAGGPSVARARIRDTARGPASRDPPRRRDVHCRGARRRLDEAEAALERSGRPVSVWPA